MGATGSGASRGGRRIAALVVASVAGMSTAAWAQAPSGGTPASPTRGQLLYATHCIECHNSQMHWRDRRLATDWASLKAQVRHWQALAFLNWSEADIVEVTRHLNTTIYRFAPGDERLGRLGAPSAR